VPVWHRDTAKWRDSGELVVVGITQEQHPDRTRLFAQWHGLDWPILWDPFNVTGSQAVPFACAIDEHGEIRSVVKDAATLGEAFRERELEHTRSSHTPGPPTLFALDRPPNGDAALQHAALRDLLVPEPERPERLDEAVDELVRMCAARDAARDERNQDDGRLLFQTGVALRMRVDSGFARPGDFQSALDHWAKALERDPNQYIWRRRIQQYGPRLDKPYPFYGWVAEARAAIRARGEEPVELVATLTGSELADGARTLDVADAPACPDPQGEIDRDTAGLVAIETATAWDTTKKSATATVHLTLTPDAERDAHWTNDAGPLVVWIGDPDLPKGWRASRRLLTHPGPTGSPGPAPETSSEPRMLDVEVQLPPGSPGGALAGFALYYVCEGAGECVYRRQDFTVALRP
jgi:hypothetical protein